jgi:hypothetical protein
MKVHRIARVIEVTACFQRLQSDDGPPWWIETRFSVRGATVGDRIELRLSQWNYHRRWRGVAIIQEL